MCGSRGFKPPALDVFSSVGGLVRRSSTHQLKLVVVESILDNFNEFS
jgi:hypothetical protein